MRLGSGVRPSARQSVDDLLSDLRDLQQALDECDDGAKATRLRLTLESRRRQLAELRGE